MLSAVRSAHLQNPSNADCKVALRDFGVELVFEPVLQRLKSISIRKPCPATLTYHIDGREDGVIDLSEDASAAFQQILHLFGPSSGVFDRAHDRFKLVYPGLTLSFPVSKDKQKLFRDHQVDLTQQDNGTFPDGSVPRISEMSVHAGSDGKSAADAAALPGAGHGSAASHYGEPVAIKVNEGLYFEWRRSMVKFGASPQEIITLFGAPSQAFFKAGDKMKIHSTFKPGAGRSDYFFNYFDLGVDMLFDGRTHTLCKFVLHANQPGHFDFERYYRCNFQLLVPERRAKGSTTSRAGGGDAGATEAEPAKPAKSRKGKGKGKGKGGKQPGGDPIVSDQPTSSSSSSSSPATRFDSIDLDGPEEVDGTVLRNVDGSSAPAETTMLTLTPSTLWPEAECQLAPGKRVSKSVAFNREPATNASNPYGSTYLYATYVHLALLGEFARQTC